MTPLDVARRFIRQRGTHCSHPEFARLQHMMRDHYTPDQIVDEIRRIINVQNEQVQP